MCFLEVAMCEKCRSSYFQSERGSKKLEEWEGLKNFRTGGGGGFQFGGGGGGGGCALGRSSSRET